MRGKAGHLALALALALFATVAHAGSIGHTTVEVIDGDTIRVGSETYRLVGFDTPESGFNARCESERALAAKAVFRLRQLVAGGGLELQPVPCACRPGTEGTKRCNYGRLCGVLKARGRDVADIMIGDGLAHRYECRATQCPPRQSWCG